MSKANGVLEKPRPRAKAPAANEPPATARFHVTQARAAELEMGDLIDIMDGNQDPRIMARFVGVFAVDEDGDYLPAEAARAVVRKMTVKQLLETFESIAAEVNEVAVPNE